MCESEPFLSPSLPKSTPNFQLPSPDTSSRYSPHVLRRMQTDACFRCRQQGHWMRDCPLTSPNSKSHVPIAEKSDFPKIFCRCGHGYCEVKTAKNDRNCGRSFYACPIKRGEKCTVFVKWCDDPIDESYLRPPPIKYPTCSCGAGVCRKEKETSGPNKGLYYFACPIEEGHGACNFRLWEDTLLGTPNIASVPQSGQKTLHDYWEGNQVDKTNIDELGKDGDCLLDHSKRMRITGDSEYSSVMAVSELLKGEDVVPKEVPIERRDHDETTELSTTPNGVDFPQFDLVDDLQDIDMINSVVALEEKELSKSHLSTPSKIHSRQKEFQRQLSAAADAPFGDPPLDPSADPCPMGWLGRLVFCHPTLSLKFPSPQPFFCCVFPSFQAIIIPRQKSNHDGLYGESNQLLISNTDDQHKQPSIDCHAEISADVVSPSISPDSERRPLSKVERQKQTALFLQLQLLEELESLNGYESMRVAAEGTFDLLNSLSVDYKQFSEHVWEFINSTLSLAEIQKFIQNCASPGEHYQRYEEEKVRLANIRDNYDKTKALLEVSQKRSQSLREEASRLKVKLHEIEDQLASCELETSKMETDLGEINTSMLEAERSLKITVEKADTARKLSEEREAKQLAAKTALEKAKLELGK